MPRESPDAPEDLPENAPGQVTFGQLEDEVPSVPNEVPAGPLLCPVDRALGAVDIVSHTPVGRSRRSVLDQCRVEASKSLLVPLSARTSVSNQWSVEVSATLVFRRSREASMRKGGSSASRSASLVFS